MHGLKSDDFYKTSEERETFERNLEKGFKILDFFVDYSSKLEATTTFNSIVNQVCDSDKKMFDLSSIIIEFMPEFTPAWNYRKKFIQKNESNDQNKLLESLKNERTLTYTSLKKSPKSYSVWHHRLWSITSLFNLEDPNILDLLLEEVKLCFKLFTFDARNFHCWNYFNFVKHYLNLLKPESIDWRKMASEQILNLINDNFSNYSAWFQRTNLPYHKQTLTDDLELLKQAIYTDPEDRSIWHYHDWLLFKRNTLPTYLCYVNYMEESKTFNLYFNDNVRLDTDSSTFYKNESVKLKGTWKPTKLNLGISLLWSFVVNSDEDLQGLAKLELVIFNTRIEYYSLLLTNPNFFNKKIDSEESGFSRIKLVYFTQKTEVDLESLKFYEEQDREWLENDKVSKPVRVGNELLSMPPDVTLDTLRNQLTVIDELISLDSERKYLLLTKLKILKYLDEDKDVDILFEKLTVLDPLRKDYYRYMLKVHKERSKLNCNLDDQVKIDFGDLSLSRFDFRTLLPFFVVRELNLRGNKLTSKSLSDISSFLLLLEVLDLSYNNIEDLESALYSLGSLKRLKRFSKFSSLFIRLNLSGNPLKVFGHETKLQSQIELVYLIYQIFSSQIVVTDTPISENFTKILHIGTDCQCLLGSHEFILEFNHEDSKNHAVLKKLKNRP
uniref:Geranylgeranyl transferase type-2 subunit alpha n=1 Tax=Theileria annulata TaxID=5874 RepID=A0A3B0N240_THEAN